MSERNIDVDVLDVDGNINIPGIRPRACVAPGRTHTRKGKGRPLGTACTWTEACNCVDQIIETMFGSVKDRGIWVWYTTYLGDTWVLELAFRVHSEWKQVEIKDPVRAFQRHLMDELPKGGAR